MQFPLSGACEFLSLQKTAFCGAKSQRKKKTICKKQFVDKAAPASTAGARAAPASTAGARAAPALAAEARAAPASAAGARAAPASTAGTRVCITYTVHIYMVYKLFDAYWYLASLYKGCPLPRIPVMQFPVSGACEYLSLQKTAFCGATSCTKKRTYAKSNSLIIIMIIII